MFFTLETFWFFVLLASVTFYAMLDGFDLGIGLIHLFVKKDEERRIFLNAIGHILDGNEVWLVVLIGGLLAGFPIAYATLFAAFYTPMIALIFGLILRAVAIEFRSKKASPLWRKSWDFLFFLGSFFITFLIGAALGHLIHGVPLNENQEFIDGDFFTYMSPYVGLIALLAMSVFILHGLIYLLMKTEDVLQNKIKKWINPALIFFIIVYVLATMATLIYEPHMGVQFRNKPYLFLIAIGNVLAIANIPRAVHQEKMGMAFLSSCVNIAFLLLLFALGIYPEILHSTLSPHTNSMTIFNAAASHKTLSILAIIVAIGIPLVIAYGFYIHKIFMGKVKLDHSSY